MKLISFHLYFLLAILSIIPSFSCNKYPLILKKKTISGYVICREICFENAEKDTWLVDFTYLGNQEQIGDTLTIRGVKYKNLVKVVGLDSQLQKPGLAIKVDYLHNARGPGIPIYCNHRNKEVYYLKLLDIISQSEIP